MTLYERFKAQDAGAQVWRDLWAPPLEQAVRKVDTKRPSTNGIVALNLPAFKGRPELTYQNLAHLQQRAAAIRQVLATHQQTKDRGS